jgi:hypothetical protein
MVSQSVSWKTQKRLATVVRSPSVRSATSPSSPRVFRILRTWAMFSFASSGLFHDTLDAACTS